MELNQEPLIINDFIQEIFQSFTYIQSEQLSMSCIVDEEIHHHLLADHHLLRQILINLLGNAIKFTSEGSVDLIAKSRGIEKGLQSLRIEIVDTGIGIPYDKRNYMFKPFSQIDSATDRKFEGTDLGLAFCKKVIQLMGGDIGFHSEPKQGTTFGLSSSCRSLKKHQKQKPLKIQIIRF